MTSAVLDDDVVVVTIKADEHFAVARDKQAIVVNGLIVNVILAVVAVVEIERALFVFALCPVIVAVITNHPNGAIGVINVVLAVRFNVIVDTGKRDVDLVVFVVTKVECYTAWIIKFSGGLSHHCFGRRNQVDSL